MNTDQILKPKSIEEMDSVIKKMHPYEFVMRVKLKFENKLPLKNIGFKKKFLYYALIKWPEIFAKYFWYAIILLISSQILALIVKKPAMNIINLSILAVIVLSEFSVFICLFFYMRIERKMERKKRF